MYSGVPYLLARSTAETLPMYRTPSWYSMGARIIVAGYRLPVAETFWRPVTGNRQLVTMTHAAVPSARPPHPRSRQQEIGSHRHRHAQRLRLPDALRSERRLS